jgi:hypothetical protein
MKEYKPKLLRTKHIPFGYYLAPGEQRLALPDPKALDALHYALQMKAKYKTPLRDCTMWLQRATGYKITPQGFRYIYNKWAKELRKEKRAAIMKKTQEIYNEKKKDMEEQYKQFGTSIDEKRDIASLAYAAALKAWKERQQRETASG